MIHERTTHVHQTPDVHDLKEARLHGPLRRAPRASPVSSLGTTQFVAATPRSAGRQPAATRWREAIELVTRDAPAPAAPLARLSAPTAAVRPGQHTDLIAEVCRRADVPLQSVHAEPAPVPRRQRQRLASKH